MIHDSLGLDAIFLLGGASREDPVFPIRLSSGDMMIMSGPCRRNYHGVPRIIENSLPKPLSSSSVNEPKVNHDTDRDWLIAASLIQDARINVNIRQVM